MTTINFGELYKAALKETGIFMEETEMANEILISGNMASDKLETISEKAMELLYYCNKYKADSDMVKVEVMLHFIAKSIDEYLEHEEYTWGKPGMQSAAADLQTVIKNYKQFVDSSLKTLEELAA